MSLPARITATLAALLLLLGIGWRIHTKADAAGYARAQGEHAAQALERLELARQREHAAAQAVINAHQKAAHETRDLQRRLADLADGLRQRTERPADLPIPQGAPHPVACTAAQLYREDAAFLVGEAARADQLRIDLATCQSAYDAAVIETAE